MATLRGGKKKAVAAKTSKSGLSRTTSMFSKRPYLRDIPLVVLIGSVPFMVSWFIVKCFPAIDCPSYFFAYEKIWAFSIKLIISLILTVGVFKLVDKVKGGSDSRITGAIKIALGLTVFLFIVLFAGNYESNKEDQHERAQVEEEVRDSNPYSHMSPAFIFTLDAGEETTLFNHKAGFKMLTYSDSADYKIMYEGGQTINVNYSGLREYPDLEGKDYKVKIRSNVNGQTIYVYYTRS